ncbi:MAG: thioredoxin fold domain-containing protein [Gammaproteobacteria bacterium]|nr:thioredoxin fold domain-containing protein [Gammaproteobacteria bacterium]
MNKPYLILASLILLSLSSLVSGGIHKCTAKDWALTSQEAKKSNTPILILFTADACGYCERLKQDVLNPMFERDKQNLMAVVREVDINTGGKMIDFNGERIRSRQFKARYKVYATPTLLMLDSHGNLLANPIVGYNSEEEYRALLASRLADYRSTRH